MPHKALIALKEINDSALDNMDRAKFNLLNSKLSSVPFKKLNYANESLKYAKLSSDIIIQKDCYFILYEEHKKLKNYDKSLSYYE